MVNTEQTAEKKTKKKGAGIWIAAVLVLMIIITVLALGWAATGLQLKQYQQETAQTLARVQEEKESELSQLRSETIPLQTFKDKAQQFGVSSEFLQSFFDDVLVYKDASGIVYAPIDDSLPKNDYDWSNLSRADGRIYYTEDGRQMLTGIDVSKHQGDINWSRVANDGIDYAIIRVGYRGYGTGKVLVDEYFEANVKGALSASLPVGVYFYSQAITVEEAVEEAELVLESIRPYNITFPVVFDTEEVGMADARGDALSPAERTDIVIAFCERIEQAGYHPMVYTSAKWLTADLEMSRLTQYDKWLAQYYKTPFFPYSLQMWQYTGSGKVDGIEGNVDLNIGFVDYSKQ